MLKASCAAGDQIGRHGDCDCHEPLSVLCSSPLMLCAVSKEGPPCRAALFESGGAPGWIRTDITRPPGRGVKVPERGFPDRVCWQPGHHYTPTLGIWHFRSESHA
jgi:hypothetical protein